MEFSEINEPGAGELVPRQSAEISTLPEIARARLVLQTIVDTDENTLPFADSPPELLSDYTVAQIREAERVVARSVIEDAGPEKGSLSGNLGYTKKSTPQGEAEILLDEDQLRLTLDRNEVRVVTHAMRLEDEPVDPARSQTYFSDPHSGGLWLAGLDGPHREKGLTAEGFRHVVRGTRWMSENMLRWDEPRVIMPAELPGAYPQPDPRFGRVHDINAEER